MWEIIGWTSEPITKVVEVVMSFCLTYICIIWWRSAQHILRTLTQAMSLLSDKEQLSIPNSSQLKTHWLPKHISPPPLRIQLLITFRKSYFCTHTHNTHFGGTWNAALYYYCSKHLDYKRAESGSREAIHAHILKSTRHGHPAAVKKTILSRTILYIYV